MSNQSLPHHRALLPRKRAEAKSRTKAATPKNGTSTAMSATTEATSSAAKDAHRSPTSPASASEPSPRESGSAGTVSRRKHRESRPPEQLPPWQAAVEQGWRAQEIATYRCQGVPLADQDAPRPAGESLAFAALPGHWLHDLMSKNYIQQSLN